MDVKKCGLGLVIDWLVMIAQETPWFVSCSWLLVKSSMGSGGIYGHREASYWYGENEAFKLLLLGDSGTFM